MPTLVSIEHDNNTYIFSSGRNLVDFYLLNASDAIIVLLKLLNCLTVLKKKLN